MLVKPRSCAQPSSRSIVLGSNVSACHISSWLMAVLGPKLDPTSQGCLAYQALACSGVHFSAARATGAARRTVATRVRATAVVRFICGSYFLRVFLRALR